MAVVCTYPRGILVEHKRKWSIDKHFAITKHIRKKKKYHIYLCNFPTISSQIIIATTHRAQCNHADLSKYAGGVLPVWKGLYSETLFWGPHPHVGNHCSWKCLDCNYKSNLQQLKISTRECNHSELREKQTSIFSMCCVWEQWRDKALQSAVEHMWVFVGALCISVNTSDHLRPHRAIHTAILPISVQPKVSFSEL